MPFPHLSPRYSLAALFLVRLFFPWSQVGFAFLRLVCWGFLRKFRVFLAGIEGDSWCRHHSGKKSMFCFGSVPWCSKSVGSGALFCYFGVCPHSFLTPAIFSPIKGDILSLVSISSFGIRSLYFVRCGWIGLLDRFHSLRRLRCELFELLRSILGFPNID